MPEDPRTQVVWHTVESVDYMLSDLVDAVVLLHNVGVVDFDEQKRLVEQIVRRFPRQPTVEEAAAERAAEQAGDWVREDFDPHSELTKERDGYRADAEAERRRQDLWGS
tara:strand:+ start:74 stop:400 length:327 start_codon:yes stop_codon:yes gene_type:complete